MFLVVFVRTTYYGFTSLTQCSNTLDATGQITASIRLTRSWKMTTAKPSTGFRLHHIGLRVASLERSINFYSEVFGLQEIGRVPLDTVSIVFLGYVDREGPDVPLFAREGVLELIGPNVTASLAI